MKIISDFLFVVVLAATLWVAAWFMGDLVGGYRRQVAELAAQLDAANDQLKAREYQIGRLKAKIGSAAAEILERRLNPEECYELLLKANAVE